MKKSLKRKLALSAITLGVAAFSVSATTFAWFTSNSDVNASGVEGTVAQDDSIYISSDNTNWGKTCTLDASAITFAPLQLSNGDLVDLQGSELPNSYFEFTLYFRGTAGKNVVMTSANITTDASSQRAFVLNADAGSDAAYKKNATIAAGDIDASDAICLNFNGKTYRNSAENPSAGYSAVTYYNNFFGYTSGNPGFLDAASNTTVYESTTLDSVTSSSSIVLGTFDSNGEFSLTFKLYLDGWDNECFDVICSQVFNAEFAFSSAAAQ